MKYKTMDANEAVASVAYKFSEMCGIYPITPASPMAEHVDEMASKHEKNFFGNKVKVVEMQSEAGAIALCHGALQSGVLATTFTASQGLLLMIPTLYKMAGEMLPGVVHVAARSLATHALSIFGDHQDVYAARSTGVCMLSSSSVQESYYMAAIAHLASINGSLPFIHFFDGFRTSHEIDKIKLMNLDNLLKLIDKGALKLFRNRGMNTSNATTRGTAENEDIYFQHMESRNSIYNNMVDVVESVMHQFNKMNGTNIQPFNYYGCKNPDSVIIAMGSVCDTISLVVDELNRRGKKVGVINVHLYRPFSIKHLLGVLPNSVKNVAVLDRAKDAGAAGEPLYLDVVNALYGKNIKVIGGRYGLASKNTTPSQIKAVFDFLASKKARHNFTIGIHDDVTNLSLNVDNKFHLPKDELELLIYGYGSDGMVSTSKDLIKIIGDNTNNFVQGYFQYDSKKSGGVTRSHIRVGNQLIKKPYYVENPNLVVVSKDSYMYKYDVLDTISSGGTLLLNTNLAVEDLIKSLPNKIKRILADKKIKFYIINANDLVNQLGLRNKISTCMEICIFKLLNIMNIKKVNAIMKETNEKRFKSKGKNVVDINNKVVDEAILYLKEVDVDSSWKRLSVSENISSSLDDVIGSLKGDDLPVSSFLDYQNGVFPGGNTKYEKRDIAERVPCWNPENCIQCNQCAFVCPHAVIRPYLVDSNDKNIDNTVPSIMPRDVNYTIGVSYKDCTGCGVCSSVCPGKMGKKAITMENYDRNIFKQDRFDYLENHNLNDKYPAKIMNVKNEGFVKPKFQFSGSCAGCGETAYLKNLTQMFPNNLYIANATGCSSIYGASMPSRPYDVAWANSLFEDNAEFGLGIANGLELKRDKIESYMLENINKDKELFTRWIENRNDYDVCDEIRKKIDFKKHKYLLEYADFIVPSSLWIVGGDGFAYDIGYGGLDHVLSRNDNVNILVLDTEVYSNTGGQASKSSNKGAVVQFASSGKSNFKKDLARIAMCYPHVYVACVNIGYNKEHYLKVLKEAALYQGPSLVIAYSPCIEHGIRMGMEYSLDNSNLATKCGYFLTFRYNPSDGKFTLDSKNPDFSLYDEFLSGENRYANLKRVNEKDAEEILNSQKEWAMKRYEFYKKLDTTD